MKTQGLRVIRNNMERRVTHHPAEGVYTIGVASRMVNIPVTIIREYEEWGLILPHITPSGRRLFSDIDIKNMIHLRTLQKDFHLNLSSLRYFCSCLPCWLIKGCDARSSAKCEVRGARDTPCWEHAQKISARPREECRSCSVYESVSRLGQFKELLWSLAGNRSASLNKAAVKEE